MGAQPAGGDHALYLDKSTSSGGWETVWADWTVDLSDFTDQGAVLSFWSSVGAILMYITFSLLGKKEICNMDKLLHRGKYAVKDDQTKKQASPIGKVRRILGINKDFNTKDKIIYLGVMGWTFGLLIIFVGVTAWNFLFKVTNQWWIDFWYVSIWVLMITGTLVTILFAVGGFRDMFKMFKRLKNQQVDETDDGRVLRDVVDEPGENRQ